MTDITVKLETTANPAVTCTPNPFNANSGNQQIKWKPGGSESFTFSSLTGLTDNPPFSGLTVGASEITIQDNDQGPGEYGYNIYVASGGTTYSTKMKGPIAGDGDPVVKNK